MRTLKSIFAAFACLALAAGPAGAQAAALTRIGVAAAVSGSVMAFAPAPQAVGRIVESGKPLYLNEKVTTDAKGRLQIMLPDETVFTIGPNSAMKLDEFVYDPNTGAGKVSASILKGVFRFVTGQVAKNRPSDMKVNLPVGTLGIRGTIVAGTVDGKGAHCILLGPGPLNNGGERVGSFSLANDAGSVNVDRPGYGTSIIAGQAPTTPSLVSAADLGALLGSLSASSGESKEESGDTSSPADNKGASSSSEETAGDLAGQDTAGAAGDLLNTESAGTTGGESDGAARDATQALSDPSIILNGASNWEDVRSIPTGAGIFIGESSFDLTKCSGGPCDDPSGLLDFVLNVDFANKTLGGAGANGIPSYVAVAASDPGTDTSINDTINIGAISFDGAGGPALLFDQSVSGNLSVLFSLQNANGLAAAFAEALAVYNDGSTSGDGFVDAGFSGDRGDISAAIINALPASTWSDIRNIPNGTGRYEGGGDFTLTQCAGGACGDPYGFFSFSLNVDFRTNTIGGDCSGSCVASQASVFAEDPDTETSISDSLTVPARSFAGLSGNAVLTQVSDSGDFTMQYTLRNAGDFAAGLADALATYNDGDTIGSGDGFAGLEDTSNEILDGLTSTWDQVRNVPLGRGVYQGGGSFNLTQCSGGSCVDPFGFFGFILNVDFARQTLGGDCNGSCVASQAFLSAADPDTNTEIADSIDVESQSFASLPGDAILHQVSQSGYMSVDFSLKNANGLAAGLVDAMASFDDGSTSGSGAASGFLDLTGTTGGGSGGTTDAQWDDLRGIPQGKGRYAGFAPFTLTRCAGGACDAPSGFMAFSFNVDFADQTIGGDCGGGCVASHLAVSASDSGTNTEISDSMALAEQYYGSLGGAAVISGVSDSGYLSATLALKNGGGLADLADVSAVYDDGSTAGSGEAFGDRADVSEEVLDGLVSTWDDVRNIPSGTGKFAGTAPFSLTQCVGASCLDPQGTFSYLLNVNFASQEFGGDCNGGCAPSGATVSAFDAPRGTAGRVDDSLTIPAQDFASLSGDAAVHGVSDSTYFTIDFTLKNAGGVAAALAEVFASYSDGSNIGSGTDTASRQETSGETLIFAGASSWDEVRAVPSGLGLFSGSGSFDLTQCAGGPCGAPSGYFSYALSVDFANQIIGGDCGGGCVASQLSMNATDSQSELSISDSLTIPARSYASFTGAATLHGTSDSGFLDADFSLDNAPGIAAALADVVVGYDDGSWTGSGSATGAERSAQTLVFAGPTSWDELRAIPSGNGQWHAMDSFNMNLCNLGACAGPSGSIDFTMNIDFANKTLGGNCGGQCSSSGIGFFASDANLPGTFISDSISIPDTSFSALNGAAAMNFASPSGFFNADFSVANVAGIAGHLGTVSATYDDGLNSGAGTATGVLIDCATANCGGN